MHCDIALSNDLYAYLVSQECSSNPHNINVKLPYFLEHLTMNWYCHLHVHGNTKTIIAIDKTSQYILILPFEQTPSFELFTDTFINAWKEELWWLIIYENVLTDLGHQEFKRSIKSQPVTCQFLASDGTVLPDNLQEAITEIEDALATAYAQTLDKHQQIELTFKLNQTERTKLKKGTLCRFFPSVKLIEFALAGFYRHHQKNINQLMNSQGQFKEPISVAADNIISIKAYLEQEQLNSNQG
ncbi:hypothetical protein PULV_a3469 [Pseudoalteromonas ulvae UL12]|uniref:Uncharacterized protein n=1 Tax=Pseudoalteromonas ulvae TaxID=107327 RepID=A0A244CTF9_PSEDV|nr:hypothetical protein [Pseudoalteromonas ulvae]MBE0363287.1 hypothetical protein [Pseudoalteromonas ulvae UL12]OUL58893.1 hypothetical protein B1199_01005 [Pseudoalteromonas ulvae]